MDRKKNFTAGFLRENPVFSLYLVLCSTLAITTTLNNAIGMGVAVIAVLIMSNVIISLIRNIHPKEILRRMRRRSMNRWAHSSR